jgi:hypothetical protein
MTCQRSTSARCSSTATPTGSCPYQATAKRLPDLLRSTSLPGISSAESRLRKTEVLTVQIAANVDLDESGTAARSIRGALIGRR